MSPCVVITLRRLHLLTYQTPRLSPLDSDIQDVRHYIISAMTQHFVVADIAYPWNKLYVHVGGLCNTAYNTCINNCIENYAMMIHEKISCPHDHFEFLMTPNWFEPWGLYCSSHQLPAPLAPFILQLVLMVTMNTLIFFMVSLYFRDNGIKLFNLHSCLQLQNKANVLHMQEYLERARYPIRSTERCSTIR